MNTQAPERGEGMTRSVSSLIFTAACNGSGTANDGVQWTVTSDGTESSFDNTKGIHYGTNSAAVQYINLSTSGISGTITQVVVNASTASGVSATVGVTIGGSAFGGDPKSLTATATEYTFQGSASGEIVVLITKPESATKALYCKSIVVTYTSGGAPTTYTVTYAAGDHGTGTMTDSNSPYEADDQVTLLSNTFTPDNGYQWDAWEVKDSNDNPVTVNNGTFTMPASNVTVTAQWTQTGGGGNTGSITITQNEVDQFTNSYAWYDWTANSVSGKMYAYKNNGMQFNSSKDAYWVYNSTAVPGRITSITMKKASGTDRSWTLRVGNSALTATNSGTQMGQSQTVGTNGATWNVTGNYDYFLLYVSGGATVISSIVINYETVTTPTISFNPSSISLGNVPLGQQIQETFTVAQANLTAGITLSANVGTLSTNSIAQGAAATQVTWTYTPSAAGAINATVTATSGTLNETLAITGTAKAAHNITINQMTNGSVTASANSAVEGETITLTVTPDAGYMLDALTVTNTTTSQTVTVTNNTFEMPDAPVTVSATFTTIPVMTVEQALAATAPQNGVFVSGIISKIDEVSTSFGNATYWISDDGTTTTQMKIYRGKYLGNVEFTSEDQIAVGDEVVVTGNIADYQGENQLAQGNYIVSLVHQQVQQYTLSLGNYAHITEFFMFDGNESPIEFDANDEVSVNEGSTVYVSVGGVEDCYVLTGLTVTYGNNQTATVTEITPNVYYSFVMPAGDATLNFVTTQAQQYELTVGTLSHVTLEIMAGEASTEVESGDDVCEGLNVTVMATPEAGYTIQSLSVVDGNSATVTVNNEGNGVYWFVMPSSNVTVTATAAERTLNTYTLATSIVAGQTYLITNGGDWAMGKQNSNNRAAATVLNGNAGTIVVGSDDEDVYEFIINEFTSSKDGQTLYTIQDTRSGKYLCSTNASDKNYLKEQETLTDNGKWAITFANGEATIVAQSGSRNNMRYNPNNGSPIFSCYASTSTTGSLPVLYVKNENVQTQTYPKTIQPYSGDGGYYLIASPVVGVVPKASNGFLTNDYDFYYFDQSEEYEWRNFEAGSYDLVSGKGYLYANSGNNGAATTLTFTGVPYSGNGQVTLDYDENASFAGWNLIGNPYSTAATINKPFYRMGEGGTALSAQVEANSTVEAMEGVFVQAANDGELATFTATNNGDAVEPNAIGQLNVSVSRNRGSVVDNAIVRFDGGAMLGKFMLNENGTKLYVPQSGKEYAIVNAQAEGELPVNFKASQSGSYTISVNPENVEMTYLHLIDNMTGADVDLLATPSYTFDARTTDYASRFRLVFASICGDADGDNETFAYYDGSSWQVSNTGEASLQVVDVLGRIVNSQTINGNASINVSERTGVYMLRLVNGENVKVQKIVIK